MSTLTTFPKYGLAWGNILGLILVHAAAVLMGVMFFSWEGVAAFAALSVVTGMVGITAGYHRLLTHQSFKTPKVIRWAFAAVGSLAVQGSVFKWVADHRAHHRHSDEEGDPHSPVQNGFWYSHLGWILQGMTRAQMQEHYRANIRDLLKDPGLVFIDYAYKVIVVLSFIALFAVGWLLADDWRMGLSLIAWGGFIRIAFVYHTTWFVNSATHLWGYRNYETTDGSRNLWWVALLAMGEGWHNNHHAHQVAANHGFHRWWEFDITYVFIRLLWCFGLAWDVRHVSMTESHEDSG